MTAGQPATTPISQPVERRTPRHQTGFVNSPSEAAAIQGFAEDMEWRGTQSATCRQIGNAVPPKVAYAIAAALRDAGTLAHGSPCQ